MLFGSVQRNVHWMYS